MADPYSILAGTVGIIDVTSRFIQYMIATGADAANVNNELQTLRDEFETLSSVAISIRDLCTTGAALQPLTTSEDDPQPLKDLKRCTGTILTNCKQTLESLLKLVKEILGNNRNTTSVEKHNSNNPFIDRSTFVKRIESFRVQLRKQRKDGEFTRLRERLNTYQSGLQLALQAINQ